MTTQPTRSASLSAPLQLPCGQELPNRIMKAALSEGLADRNNLPDTRIERLYSRWSDGCFGLIITGNVMVDSRHLGEPGNIVLQAGEPLEGFRRWAKAAQNGGTPIWMQLNHPGRQANPFATPDLVGPSAVALGIPGATRPRALKDAEITDIVARFADAARLAEEAGFDGVQIHGAHGYLISQFLSPLSNVRTDSWGGSIENRTRIVIEILKAVRSAVSPGFGLGIKLNSADFQRGGFTESDSRVVIDMVADEAVDLIEISGGSYESPAMMGRPVQASTRARETHFLDYAATVRELAGTVPLTVTGGFRTRAGALEAIESGVCDVIGIGRPSAIMPTAARELLDGTVERLPTRTISLPVPRVIGSRLRPLEGALDLQWHTDQLHLMGDGREPNTDRSAWRTVGTTLSRNGVDGLKVNRRNTSNNRALQKFRFERFVGRHVANPLVAALTKAGIRTTLATEFETTGRKTGKKRTVPVAAAFDDDGAWIISQHSRRSGWALNIDADPRVRIRQGDRWRSGTARFDAEDDIQARTRSFATNPLLAPLVSAGFAALQSDAISVRITFDSTGKSATTTSGAEYSPRTATSGAGADPAGSRR